MTKLYQAIATKLNAMANCAKSGNDEWHTKHEDALCQLIRDHMPSGSGFDNGTKLDFDASKDNKLVFLTSFHHMNDGGMYDGWTEHSVVVTPSLVFGFDLRITGRDRNDIKDYIGEVFHDALSREVDPYPTRAVA